MVTVKVRCTRGSQLYTLGETAKFEIVVEGQDGLSSDATVNVQLSSDTAVVFLEKTFSLAGETKPLMVEGTMPMPGFLRCRATVSGTPEPIMHECGVGFDPEKIRPVLPEPEDFDAFWSDALGKLNDIPADPKCDEVPEMSTPDYTAYRVSLANINNTRIYGLLTVPTAKHGTAPFPTVFEVPSAGPPIIDPAAFAFKAQPRNYIIFNVNVFDFDPGTDKETRDRLYKALMNNGNYTARGLESRESYYFHSAVVGIHRAMKWLYERKDVDKKRFVYYGGSQGGFFGFNQMALGEGRFTAGLLHIPAFSDTSGSLIGRHPMRPPGEDAKAVIETMAYYDPVNFARRISCPVMVTVGFIDNACHPSGVYAAYNTLPGEKYILNCLESGHSGFFNYTLHRTPMYGWLQNRMSQDFQ